jgi:hypothetical protein
MIKMELSIDKNLNNVLNENYINGLKGFLDDLDKYAKENNINYNIYDITLTFDNNTIPCIMQKVDDMLFIKNTLKYISKRLIFITSYMFDYKYDDIMNAFKKVSPNNYTIIYRLHDDCLKNFKNAFALNISLHKNKFANIYLLIHE